MAASDIKARIGADFTGFNKSLQTFEKKLSRAIYRLEKRGQDLTRSISAPVVIMAGLSAKVFGDFEQSMLKVKAISGATDKDFAKLTETAKQLGSSTMFTASQVAELQLNLSKLGFSTKEIEESTESVLRLAQATDSELGEAATVAAGTLKGFSLEAREMGRVSDVMADAFSSTALDMEKFKISMAYVAPVANQAKVSLEETTAILGVLVNRNVDASSAGAALRNVYLDLADKGLSWADAMKMITSDSNPLSTAMELFGKRGASVATIIANNAQEIQGLTKDFRESKGEAQKMAEIMDSGLMGAFRRLKSEVEGVAIEIGQKLTPLLLKLGDIVSSSLRYWKSLSDGTQNFILKVTLITAAIGPVLIVFAKLLSIIKLATAAFRVLSITMLANPFVLIAAAVASVVVGIIALTEHLRSASDETKFLDDANQKLNKSIAKEQANIDKLFGTMKNLSKPMEERQKALDEINRLYPGYLESTKIEEININKVADAYDRMSKAMRNKLIEQQRDASLTELTEKQIELELKKQRIQEKGYNALGGNKFYGEKAKLDQLGIGLLAGDRNKGESGKEYAVRKVLEEIDAELKQIEGTTKSVNTEFDKLLNPNKNIRGGAGGAGFNFGGKRKGNNNTNLGGDLKSDIKVEVTPVIPDDVVTTGIEGAENIVKAFESRMPEIELKFKELKPNDVTFGKTLEDIIEKLGEDIGKVVGVASQLFSQLDGITNQYFENKEARIEKDFNKQKKYIESSILGEANKNQLIAELEEDRSKKVNELRRKEAISNKVKSIFDSIINTAVAVTSALSSGPAGIALAGIIGAMGAVQTGLIASQPIPALARGGLAYGPTMSLIGDNPNASVDPEVIAPLSKLGPMIQKYSNGNSNHLTGSFRLSGNDAELLVSNAKQRKNRMYGKAI